MNSNEAKSMMPELYDRLMGNLTGLPDVTRTKESIVRSVPPLGVGGTETFVVQTFRQREEGDTIFMEVGRADGLVRLVIPPAVSAVILRQHDSLTTMVRKKVSKAAAQDRKARGIQPGFMKRRKK